MLTATYSLVAIAAEQDKTRGILFRLQQYVQTGWRGLHDIDFSFFENAFAKLTQFDKYCRGRKIEMYLMPVLRGFGREAEALIEELEAMSTQASMLLVTIAEQLNHVFERGHQKAGELVHAMEVYCNHLYVRLDKEDKELLPLARRLFSIEDWFSIAAKLLSDDADAHGRKRHAPASNFTSPSAEMQSVNLQQMNLQ